jgi:ATP-dependent Clp protease ATP-binding subunit ClpC
MQKYLRQMTAKASEAIQRGVSEMVSARRRLFTPEWLLVGLLEQNESVVMKILEETSDDPPGTRRTLLDRCLDTPATEEDRLPPAPPGPPGRHGPQVLVVGEIQGVLERGLELSREFGDSYIGTGAVFLALLDDRAGRVARILREAGLDAERSREAYLRLRGGRKLLERDAERRTEFLEQFTTDLTAQARRSDLDPVIGRETEIRRVIQILSRRKKNNPVVIGEPGVGKTVIIEGLAQRIAEAEVPATLLGKRVLSLDMGEVTAGAKMRGELEERIKAIKDEVIAAGGQIILFIDELHLVVGAGGGDAGGNPAANLLKPALARGQLQCVGATTTEEYKRYIEKDKALERRFQPILIEEPSVERTVEILHGLRERYEQHHHVRYADEALKRAATLSERYVTDRRLPDKAIDLIDEAGSRKHIDVIYVGPEMARLEKERQAAVGKKQDAFATQDFEVAAHQQQIIFQLEDRIRDLREGEADPEDATVDADDVAAVVAEWTGIPAARIAESEATKLARMEESIHRRIIGQENAVRAVCDALRRNRAGLRDQSRPIGSFLFLGPTGVGKTELAKALAEFLLDDETKIVRLDMSEYAERHQVARLIGAPPGYVGYGEGGQLTERIRRRPYTVILLDEMEKAHHDVFNILLQVLDEGTLTDSEGRTVSFRNTILVGTSNIGSARIMDDQKPIGFGGGDGRMPYDEARRRVMDEVRKTFKPEFINRIDDIIVFHQLEKTHLRKIVDLLLAELVEQLAERSISLTVDPEVRDLLVDVGFSPAYGARPLKREVERRVENPLSMAIIDGKFREGDRVRASLVGENEIELQPAG